MENPGGYYLKIHRSVIAIINLTPEVIYSHGNQGGRLWIENNCTSTKEEF